MEIVLTLLLLPLSWLRQEELCRGLERMTGHQNQLLELQQLLDVLQRQTQTRFNPQRRRKQKVLNKYESCNSKIGRLSSCESIDCQSGFS